MIVGLTGGIGSGKTTVAQLFETMGCAIYNSDERAKQLYYNPSVKKQVINLLGIDAYINNQEINKGFISQKVFSDSKLLQQLNNIIHPAVKEDFILFQSKYNPETLVIKETALLFETEIYKNVDYSILITAPLQTKIERVTKRNAISEKEILNRMSSQWTDEQKTPLANFIVINDNTHPLIPQVLKIIQTIKQNA